MKVVMSVKNRRGFLLSCVFVLIGLTGFAQNSFQRKAIYLNNDTIDSKLIKEIAKYSKTHKKINRLIIDSCYCKNWSEFCDTLATFTMLKRVVLEGITLQYFSFTFSKLDSLEELLIHNCNLDLENFINEISSLKKLRYLSIGSDSAQRVPTGLSKLKQLESLCIGNNIGNQIEVKDTTNKEFPYEVLNLTGLKQLTIENLNIASIPDSIVKLSNLTSLDLPNNQITEINEQVCNLQHLEGLGLSGNQIEEVNEHICNLQHLVGLSLDGNKISMLPHCLVNLENLKFLNLSNNNFTEYPSVILDIQDRLFEHKEKKRDWLWGNEQRITLYLGGNDISSFPKRFYNKKRYYGEFSISGNPISKEEEKRIYKNISEIIGF